MRNDDTNLIEAIKKGGIQQEQAIKQLYEQCFYMVLEGRKKYSQLDQNDLLTAYGNAIIAVRRQLMNGAFREESALSTYLQKIFSNRSIDILRTKSSNKLVSAEHLPEITDDSSDVLSNWVREEEIALIRTKLKQLGGICEQILHLSEYMEYTAQQIAEKIGFSNANSVNSKKYSCLKKLRELMGA